MSNCINLKQHFTSYRLTHDPAAQSRAEKQDPWLMTIPCRFGIVWPYGRDRLAVDVDRHPSVVKKLTHLGLETLISGEHETTFLFPLERADEVFEIVQPRRRRRFTEEQKAGLVERLRKRPQGAILAS